MTNLSKAVKNEILEMKVSKQEKKVSVSFIVIIYFILTTVIALAVA